MGGQDSQTGVPALEALQGRFEAWRRSGRTGRPIPDALWDSATELAREIGVNPVVRALHLDYNRLKRRVFGHLVPKANALPTEGGPAFVELAVDTVSSRADCVVEFEGRAGKLTVRLAGHHPVDVVALAEVLCRAAR